MSDKMFVIPLIVIGVLAVGLEGRYHSDGTITRHHRHRHEYRDQGLEPRRSHRSQWPEKPGSYEEAFTPEKDEDYEAPLHRGYERTYPIRQRSHHRSRFEPQYRPWKTYHDEYYGPRRYPEEHSRRRNNRYAQFYRDRKWRERARMGRTYHGFNYPRGRDIPEEDYENEPNYPNSYGTSDELDDYDRRRDYEEDDYDQDVEESEEDYYPVRKTNGYGRNPRNHGGLTGPNRHDNRYNERVYRNRGRADYLPDEDQDADWADRHKHHGAKKVSPHDVKIDEADGRTRRRGSKFDDSKKISKRVNSSEFSQTTENKNQKVDKDDEFDWSYNEDEDDYFGQNQKSTSDDEEVLDEEDSIWNEAEDEEDDDEDDGFDNNFHKFESKSHWKTYDEIIRSLTSEDPTTQKPAIKRDNKNHQNNAFGNLIYDHPRTDSKTSTRNVSKTSGNFRKNWKNLIDGKMVKEPGTTTQGPPSVVMERKEPNVISVVENRKSTYDPKKKDLLEVDESKVERKTLEDDYEDYENEADDDKEEVPAKAGGYEDEGMQADKNQDYPDDDKGEEDEEEEETTTRERYTTTPPTTPRPTTTTTKMTTTTTTTTMAPTVRQYYHRDTKTHYRSTGSQYNRYPSTTKYPPMSEHSNLKWQALGTRKAVNETRGNISQYNEKGRVSELQATEAHYRKVSSEGKCRWPKIKVISVRDFYPNPSTTYIPRCAILHRCSDDTGCCPSESTTCVAKRSQTVMLPFTATTVGRGTFVEKLSFVNDTECECKVKVDPYTPPPSTPQSSPKQCRCPVPFAPVVTNRGVCECNCRKNNQKCTRISRGKELFEYADKQCMESGFCAFPSCEFGVYMLQNGRCPRKSEVFTTTTSRPRS